MAMSSTTSAHRPSAPAHTPAATPAGPPPTHCGPRPLRLVANYRPAHRAHLGGAQKYSDDNVGHLRLRDISVSMGPRCTSITRVSRTARIVSDPAPPFSSEISPMNWVGPSVEGTWRSFV